MASNFAHLLKKPAGQAAKPQALPAGDYPGIIKGHEFGDNNKNKTPYVRFSIGLLGWGDSVDESDRSGDPTKRQFRRDFYLTDDALWRLDALLKDCGVEANGREYEEVLNELTGAQVTVEIQQYLNQQSGEIGNQVGKILAG